ncbi:response regulator [Flavobacterium sp. CF136]|uniref:response regulator n=1 Tax=Flavobacterium sp. (strain CF136) TaxID=1144313 RepID=UPI0002718598|nr:response regulator [Flavobacterium sp. CF136]EJL61632.1 response regulator with CheY-like receiver, AAA-type ATPase, and DNA-binding domains [Flavobacterium sp. CF136]
MKCFLIDDDEDDREIFSLALSAANSSSTYVTATNGEDALRILEDQPDYIPDFIFLDLNMPFMDGRSCLKELRKISKLRDVPVIMFTTSSYSKDIEDTLKLGASHYLIKPSSLNGLVEILISFFEGNATTYQLNP